MTARVRYNNDVKFRRRAAFFRMYRASNFKKRFLIEMAAMLISTTATLVLWFANFAREIPIYALYITGVIAIYLFSRLLRSFIVAMRVKPGEASRAQREFEFSDNGFCFGPMDESGAMLETRWRDFDKVYINKDAIYMLCMGRRHWAVADKSLLIEGDWNDIIELIVGNLPKRKIAMDNARRIAK